jgi:hypothetical protein
MTISPAGARLSAMVFALSACSDDTTTTAGAAADGATAPIHDMDAGMTRSDGGRLDGGRERDGAAVDAGANLDCSFTGTPHITPTLPDIGFAQTFALQGVPALAPGCLRWSSAPSSYNYYLSASKNGVQLDPASGMLSVFNLPDDVDLTIIASIANVEVARTTVHYFDPNYALAGAFHEVAVLRCPDHVEVPRMEVREIFLSDFKVTFHPFETFVDYRGRSTSTTDAVDPRRGTFEFTMTSGQVPQSVDSAGTYYARRDGLVELRDLWLGPDAAQCGHVLQRYE